MSRSEYTANKQLAATVPARKPTQRDVNAVMSTPGSFADRLAKLVNEEYKK